MSDKFKTVLKGMVEKWKDLPSIEEMAETLDLDALKIWFECCVENASKDNNYAFLLQELVNLLGSRLGFSVKPGKLREGPDGIWNFGDQPIVVETKTSSFYSDFEKIMNYINNNKALSGIVFSSEFSADKIAAVKGGYPRIRLMTFNSLIKLTELKNKEVLTTKHIFDVLVPQETVQLDGLVNLIYGIVETTGEAGHEVAKKDTCDLKDVPEDIKDLGEVAKAMYIILKRNPDKEFESEELSEEITKNFSVTFANKNPGIGFAWSSKALKDRDYITIQRYNPDPEKYPQWVKRQYKFKKSSK